MKDISIVSKDKTLTVILENLGMKDLDTGTVDTQGIQLLGLHRQTRLTGSGGRRGEIPTPQILMKRTEENGEDIEKKGIRLAAEKPDTIAVAVVVRIVILDGVTGATLRQ